MQGRQPKLGFTAFPALEIELKLRTRKAIRPHKSLVSGSVSFAWTVSLGRD